MSSTHLRRRWAALAATWAVVALAALDRPIPRWMAWIAAFGVLVLATDRTTFLPFLGECAMPLPIDALRPAPTTTTTGGAHVKIKTPRGATHVVYWAAQPGTHASPKAAYAGAQTSVVKINAAETTTVLQLPNAPGQYAVWSSRPLPKHVHYRAAYPSGLLGPVRTVRSE